MKQIYSSYLFTTLLFLLLILSCQNNTASPDKIISINTENSVQDKGCKNALYLDGFVSRTYLPKKNCKQLDGNFGVIIGVWE